MRKLLIFGVVLAAAVVLVRIAEREPQLEPVRICDLQAPYVRAAHWFGGHWAINFWNTNLESRAAADFALLKDDGFNTVVLLVPWPGFAPDPQSGELDMSRVQRLRNLMRLAHDMEMQVILRVSYAYDGLDEERGWRNYRIWLEDEVYEGWLDFLESIWNEVGSEPNLLFGFFSWEDLWGIMRVQDLEPDEQVRAAHASGYVHWLAARYSLEQVSRQYRVAFESWDEVTIPSTREPAFELFLKFLDWAWIERFFRPAQQRFSSLSMEVRIDSDPIFDGDELIKWHSHEAAWDLPDAEWVTLYWAPSMGGQNTGELLSPQIAAERLEWWLERIAAKTGPRRIFIGQFLVQDFTPGFEHNGRIQNDQVAEFLHLAPESLSCLTEGYGLWAWADYGHNAIANPEFFVGLEGWDHDGELEVGDDSVRMAPSSWISIAVPLREFHLPGGVKSVNLCATGRAISSGLARVQVNDSHAGDTLGVLEYSGVESEQCMHFDAREVIQLELRALDESVIRQVENVGFVQASGMRDIDGNLKPVGKAYRELNLILEAGSSGQVRSD